MNSDFLSFRERFPEFVYDGYSAVETNEGILLKFDFSVPGLCEFHPKTLIVTDNLEIANDPFSEYADRMVFFIGMAEAVSYWKCACPPTFSVRCGYLSDEDICFFKKLWFNGLGEFFFRNGIETDIDSFVNISAPKTFDAVKCGGYRRTGIQIIPVGGGKDSAVTTELLRPFGDSLRFFTVNDQPARTACVEAAGYGAERIIRTRRTIDPELLRLNSEGFLNGHTPFSSVVAFLSMYCGHITGAENIVLSNEASANDSNIGGAEVNHQYSKSFEFERDFNILRERNFSCTASYFSLLRPFNELQIAKQFAAYPQYHSVFRSCNAGSKRNIWCTECAKCLFVAIILSPFLPPEKLHDIFGCDMLDKRELVEDFDGLCGFSGVKPFECVGTAAEVTYALHETAKKYRAAGTEMPFLLRRFCEKRQSDPDNGLLKEYNNENLVPAEFEDCVKRMYNYVSAAD